MRMLKTGDFDLKIDDENKRWFIKTDDETSWFEPVGSAFKYKIPLNQWIEVVVVHFKDGANVMMPIKWLHQEKINPTEQELEEQDVFFE